MIRLGIVGANAERGWARDAHVPALRELGGWRIAAVSARSQALADAAAAAFGAERGFGDSLALVRDPGVDVVAVTVRVPEHRAVVLAALAAGKHVYCEWPLGRDAAEAAEMAAAVPQGVHAAIGLQALSAPAVRQAVALVQAGAIGRPLVLRGFNTAAAWGDHALPHAAYLQDRTNGATLETIGGGHALAVMVALAGAYEAVDARATTFRTAVPVLGTGEMVPRTSADHLLVLGRHAGGCVSSFEVLGGTSHRPASFELQGEAGWIRLVGSVPGSCQIPRLVLEASFALAPTPPAVTPGLAGPPANLAEAYAALAGDISSGRRTLPDFADAVRLTLLLEAIDRAAATGQRQVL